MWFWILICLNYCCYLGSLKNLLILFLICCHYSDCYRVAGTTQRLTSFIDELSSGCYTFFGYSSYRKQMFVFSWRWFQCIVIEFSFICVIIFKVLTALIVVVNHSRLLIVTRSICMMIILCSVCNNVFSNWISFSMSLTTQMLMLLQTSL